MRSAGVDIDEVRTGATIILAVVGIWILTVLARPLNRYKGAVVGAMYVALIVIFTVPIARAFFLLVDPGLLTAVMVTAVCLVAVCLIEIVRLVQRRYIARALIDTSHAAVHPQSVSRPAPVTIAVVLVYLGGLASAMFGILFLLSRYEVPAELILSVSLVGAGIILFGLLSVAAAAGLARGSGLSRLFVSVLAAALIGLQAWSLALAREWSWWAAAQIVVYALVLVALWLPRANRFFRPVLSAG